MGFNKTELGILKQVADGNRSVKEIAKALKRSKFQIYRSGNSLIEKGILSRKEGFYDPIKNVYANLLIQLLGEFPSVIKPLSDSGMEILYCLLEAKTIKEIMQELQIKRSQLFKKLKEAKSISLIRNIDGRYQLNEKLWGKAKEFLIEKNRYEETIDKRIPGNSIIYFKNEKEIVFSNKEKIDAAFTAFSSYKDYGIPVYSSRIFYYLPNKQLSIKEVFLHSLYITQKDMKIQDIIFSALFYAKYRKELSETDHFIRKNIEKIFEGKKISDYPSLEEIKERAGVYDIKI